MMIIVIVTIILIIAITLIYIITQQGVCYICKHYKRNSKGIEFHGICRLNNRIRSALETCIRYNSRYK